jgi:hypothetical protein
MVEDAETGTFIADCNFGTTDREVIATRAKLIAAAPELLESLEALFEQCAMVHMHWGDGDNTREADAAMTAGRAAIAKAKGES